MASVHTYPSKLFDTGEKSTGTSIRSQVTVSEGLVLFDFGRFVSRFGRVVAFMRFRDGFIMIKAWVVRGSPL